MRNLKQPILSFLAILFCMNAQAQPGALDLSFSFDGMVTTAFGNSTDKGHAIVLQPDGKIIVVGFKTAANNDFAIARYNPDGSLDLSFDMDGKVTTDIMGGDDFANDVALQADGKIVVVGYSYGGGINTLAVARYNTDGSLDNTFDTDGKLTTTFGTLPEEGMARAVMIQPDGKIVVGGKAGLSTSSDFALVRYNTDGSLDLSFDTDGKVTTNFGSSATTDQGYDVILQLDGKIVLAGSSSASGIGSDFGFARYNTNGSLDTTYGGDGTVQTGLAPTNGIAYAACLQPDGKIIGVGQGFANNFSIVRLNTDGSMDNTFDTDGVTNIPVGTNQDFAYAVALQADGKIVVAGTCESGSYYDIAIVRCNANGSLDNTFDSDGKVITSVLDGDDAAYGVTIQSDGKIVVAGSADDNLNEYFAAVRYETGFAGFTENGAPGILSCYPNPTYGPLMVQLNEPLLDANAKLFNLTGQCIFTINHLHGDLINLDMYGLENGIYFLEMQENNSAKPTARIKLLKK